MTASPDLFHMEHLSLQVDVHSVSEEQPDGSYVGYLRVTVRDATGHTVFRGRVGEQDLCAFTSKSTPDHGRFELRATAEVAFSAVPRG
jgi:hypothetical protein